LGFLGQALARLLQLGETRSGAEPQNADVFGDQHACGGNSWCHVMSQQIDNVRTYLLISWWQQ
jgi:hypothetical protein